MSQTTDDVAARIAKLSEAQRECLRLTNALLTSKEIAIRLNVSRHTVDQRLTLAGKLLGVATRKEAARLFALYDPVIYDASHIAEAHPTEPAFPNLEYGKGTDANLHNYLMCEPERSPFRATPTGKWNIGSPFPRNRGDANDLNVKSRLIWAGLILCAGIIISSVLIAALETLGRLI